MTVDEKKQALALFLKTEAKRIQRIGDIFKHHGNVYRVTEPACALFIPPRRVGYSEIGKSQGCTIYKRVN